MVLSDIASVGRCRNPVEGFSERACRIGLPGKTFRQTEPVMAGELKTATECAVRNRSAWVDSLTWPGIIKSCLRRMTSVHDFREMREMCRQSFVRLFFDNLVGEP